MRTRNRVWILVLVLLMLSTASAYAEKVSLRVAIAEYGKSASEDLAQIVAEFERIYPDISIEILDDYANEFDKLATHVIGGVAPDIMHFYNETPIIAMQNGFLMNLKPYLDREGQEITQDLLPLVLDQMTMGDGIYGLPFQTSSTGGIFYNTQMFEEAGIAHPVDWDWDEFALTASKLTKFDGDQVTVSGYTQLPAWLWFFTWLVQAGVNFDDPMRVPLDTPEAVQTFEYLREGVNRETFDWGWGPLPTLNSAMEYNGSWGLTYWVNEGIPMGIAEVPSGPQGKATLTNTNVIAINARTEYPDEAWTFLKWFYSRDAQLDYMNTFGMQPVLLSLGYEWLIAVEDLYRSSGSPMPKGIETFIQASAYALPQPFFSNAAVITRYIEPTVTELMNAPNTPIKSTLESMVQVAEAFLRENR